MERVITLFKSASNSKGYHAVMVNDQDTFDSFCDSGWVESIDQLKKPEANDMSDEERELRDEYEKLTGKKAGGRAKLETIRKMVEEAKEA